MLDVTKPPYLATLELLTALRASDQLRHTVAFAEAHADDRGTYDKNGRARDRLAHMLLVRGTAADVDLVRFLLEQEIVRAERDSFQGAGDPLTILSMLLMNWATPSTDNAWLFWKAKRANFDTFAGGYDIEFVFTQCTPDVLHTLLAERGDAKDAKMLARYDADEIVRDVPTWRARLGRMYPQNAASMNAAVCAGWAELFDDHAGHERFGLMNAKTPEARAHLYRRLERFDVAVRAWREAAEHVTSPWDKASRLQSLITDAAKVPMGASAAVEALDALRPQIASWNEVGLGRMATQACYELAAAVPGEDGATYWATAERWFTELDSFSLVGHRTALAASKRWGSAADVARRTQMVNAEHERIYGTPDPEI